MPSFHYINPLGKREEIFPHYKSHMPGCYVVEDTKARQLVIHESCIITEYDEEEISKAREEFIQKNLKGLLSRSAVRDCDNCRKCEGSKKIDK